MQYTEKELHGFFEEIKDIFESTEEIQGIKFLYDSFYISFESGEHKQTFSSYPKNLKKDIIVHIAKFRTMIQKKEKQKAQKEAFKTMLNDFTSKEYLTVLELVQFIKDNPSIDFTYQFDFMGWLEGWNITPKGMTALDGTGKRSRFNDRQNKNFKFYKEAFSLCID